MSHLINVSNEVYEELTTLKKSRAVSYTEIIKKLLSKSAEIKKTKDWKDLVTRAKLRDVNFKGKKGRIDHDLIAYGVSRDSS